MKKERTQEEDDGTAVRLGLDEQRPEAETGPVAYRGDLRVESTWNLTEVMAQRDTQGYLMDLDPDIVVVNWGNKTRCGKSSMPWQCRRGRW